MICPWLMRMVSTSWCSYHDHQGDLKASLAGGVCNTNNVFANLLYCIRLCHPNEIYLLTYLLTNAIHFLLGKLSQMTKMTNNFKCAILSQLKSTHKFCTFQMFSLHIYCSEYFNCPCVSISFFSDAHKFYLSQ